VLALFLIAHAFILCQQHASRGDLRKVLDRAHWDTGDANHIATHKHEILRKIAAGMEYLHCEGVFHRDLRRYASYVIAYKLSSHTLSTHNNANFRHPSLFTLLYVLFSPNVLITEDFTPLLADFGLSQITAKDYSTFCRDSCNSRWKAPELFKREFPTFTASCDVYSYGVVIWEMFSSYDTRSCNKTTHPMKNTPWGKLNADEIGHQLNFEKKRLSDDDYFNQKVVLDSNVKYAAVYAGVMNKCLSLQEADRPTFTDITSYLNLLPPVHR
jgi:serine/threonine protein kinase